MEAEAPPLQMMLVVRVGSHVTVPAVSTSGEVNVLLPPPPLEMANIRLGIPRQYCTIPFALNRISCTLNCDGGTEKNSSRFSRVREAPSIHFSGDIALADNAIEKARESLERMMKADGRTGSLMSAFGKRKKKKKEKN